MGSDISHDDNVSHDAPYTKIRYRSFKAYIGTYLSSVLNLQVSPSGSIFWSQAKLVGKLTTHIMFYKGHLIGAHIAD